MRSIKLFFSALIVCGFVPRIFIFPKTYKARFSPKAQMQLNDGSKLMLTQQMKNFRSKLIKSSGAELSGDSNVQFAGGTLEDNGNKVVLSGNLVPGATEKIVLDGSKKVQGKVGSISQEIEVQGSGNRIEDSSLIENDILLVGDQPSLTCALRGRLSANIILNNGLLTLEDDLHFADDKQITGSGNIHVNGRTLQFGTSDLTWSDPLFFDCAQDIEMHSSFHLATTWTFSGNSIIEGNGNTIYLDTGGEIVIDEGSSLLFKDITIQKVSGNNIRCLDNAAQISLKNVSLLQDGDCNFAIGSLQVLSKAKVGGNYTFAYQSSQTSTIRKQSKFILDSGVTFSYDPVGGIKDLLAFEDASAILLLHGASLHATITGMQLKKGTMLIEGNCSFASEKEWAITSTLDGISTATTDRGIIIGNNASDDDCILKIDSGAMLSLTQGSIAYKNVSLSSLNLYSRDSSIKIGAHTAFKLYQNADLEYGNIVFDTDSTFCRVTDKSLDGTIHVLGDLETHLIWPA